MTTTAIKTVKNISTTRGSDCRWEFDQNIPELAKFENGDDVNRLAELIHEFLGRRVGEKISFVLADTYGKSHTRWHTAKKLMLDSEHIMRDTYSIANLERRLRQDASIHFEIPFGTMPIVVSGLLYTS